MVGANTDPWGTPDSSLIVLLRVCPILTCIVRSERYVLRNLQKMAGSPSFMALWRTPMSHTLSNAFLASKNIMIVGVGCVDLVDLV